mgnify:CR=1 FL=1
MAALRQQMIRQINLKNLSPHTRRAYLSAVTSLAKDHQDNQDIFLSDIPDLVFLTANVVPEFCTHTAIATNIRDFFQILFQLPRLPKGHCQWRR